MWFKTFRFQLRRFNGRSEFDSSRAPSHSTCTRAERKKSEPEMTSSSPMNGSYFLSHVFGLLLNCLCYQTYQLWVNSIIRSENRKQNFVFIQARFLKIRDKLVSIPTWNDKNCKSLHFNRAMNKRSSTFHELIRDVVIFDVNVNQR